MQVTESTKEEAQKVLDFIDEFPHMHRQSHWFAVNGEDTGEQNIDLIQIGPKNVCNTTMCLAGTQQYLAKGKEGLRAFASEHEDRAAKDAIKEAGTAFGLGADEYDWLFYTTGDETALDALEYIADGDEKGFKSLYEKNSF